MVTLTSKFTADAIREQTDAQREYVMVRIHAPFDGIGLGDRVTVTARGGESVGHGIVVDRDDDHWPINPARLTIRFDA